MKSEVFPAPLFGGPQGYPLGCWKRPQFHGIPAFSIWVVLFGFPEEETEREKRFPQYGLATHIDKNNKLSPRCLLGTKRMRTKGLLGHPGYTPRGHPGGPLGVAWGPLGVAWGTLGVAWGPPKGVRETPPIS